MLNEIEYIFLYNSVFKNLQKKGNKIAYATNITHNMVCHES